MTDKSVSVVIPIYKEKLNEFELLSLKQCIKILSKYPIAFVAPDDIDITNYQLLFSTTNYNLVTFDKSYFKDIDSYNRLMLSPFFYKKFLAYKFILIYQLDAFVFKDELTYWCNQNYDYIGAPHSTHVNMPGDVQFLENYNKILVLVNKIFKTSFRIKNVGNGGLSLRKTRKCYWLLRLLRTQIVKWGTNNEDGFFKYWGNLFYPFFKLPPDEKALHFSIETSPKASLEKLNFELPFGCHAFEKYEWETWQHYILNAK